MYAHLTEDEIVVAIDDLQQTIGVKEEIESSDLHTLLGCKDVQGCVQRIAAWLGLPVRIELSYASIQPTAGGPQNFGSTALSQTDGSGHGVEGITAQVEIPQRLPLYGSRSLEGYVIRVRVSENCRDQPDTFLAIMAHELSHVLLGALWHKNRDSELHADLVPLLLGLRSVVRNGRKIVTTSGTTTFGYLPDSQFDFAVTHITGIVAGHQAQKQRVSVAAWDLQHLVANTEQQLVLFRDYLGYLDAHSRRRIGERDARVVVRCHLPDYTRGCQNAIAQAGRTADRVAIQVRSLVHFKQNSRQELHDFEANLGVARDQVHRQLADISRDVKVLRHCVPLSHLLRNHLTVRAFAATAERMWREMSNERRWAAIIAAIIVVVIVLMFGRRSNETTPGGSGRVAEPVVASRLSVDAQPSVDAQRLRFISELKARLRALSGNDSITVEGRGEGFVVIRYRIGLADFRANLPEPSDGVRLLVGAEGPLEKATIQALGFQTIEFEDGKGIVRRFRIANLTPHRSPTR